MVYTQGRVIGGLRRHRHKLHIDLSKDGVLASFIYLGMAIQNSVTLVSSDPSRVRSLTCLLVSVKVLEFSHDTLGKDWVLLHAVRHLIVACGVLEELLVEHGVVKIVPDRPILLLVFVSEQGFVPAEVLFDILFLLVLAG